MVYTINPKGNFLKISRMAIILLAIALAVIAIYIKVYIIFALSLFLIFVAMIIQKKTLEIYEFHFVINSRCWIQQFNKQTEYKFSDIKKFKFYPGYTNWAHVIIIMLMGSSKQHGQVAGPSEWKIIKTDDSIEYIKCIGTNKQAEKAAEYINARLTSIN